MTDPSHHVRLANSSDITELAHLRLSHKTEEGSVAVDDEAFIAAFETSMTQRLGSDVEVFVLEAERQIVASSYLVKVQKIPKPSDHSSVFLYLTGVYCLPDFRGGSGRQLLTHIHHWAKQQGMEFILAWPGEAARSLYRQLGFKPTDAVSLEINAYLN